MGKAKTFSEYLASQNEEEKKKKQVYSDGRVKTYSDYNTRRDLLDGSLSADIDTLNAYLSEMEGGWQDSKSMSRNKTSLSDMMGRVKNAQNYLSNFENVSEYSNNLDEIYNSYDEALQNFDSYAEMYSKYKNKDDFEKALKDQAETEKKIEAQKSANLDDLGSELKGLNSKIKALKDEKSKYDSEYKANGGYVPSASNYNRPLESQISGYQQWQSKTNEYQKQIDELEKQESEKGVYYNQAKLIQSADKLTQDAVNAENFHEVAELGNRLGDEKNGGWLTPDTQRKNQLAYMRNNADALKTFEDSAKSAGGAAERRLLDNLTYKAARYGTDDQIEIYNFYIGSGNNEAAEKYLKAIEPELNAAQGKQIASERDSTLKKMAFGISAGLDQFEQGVIGLFNTDGEYKPPTGVQNASSIIRESLSDTGGNVFGSSFGQVGYDLITTASNQLPSIVTSMAVSAIATPTVGSAVGAGLFGASASGNAYQEMLNAGYSKDQSRTYSVLVGASETGLQYVLGGISALGGKLSGNLVKNTVSKVANGIDNAFFKFAIKNGGAFLGSGVSEGFEEGLQDVLEPLFKNAIMHEDNKVDWGSVAYSTVLGFLTAELIEAPGTVSNRVSDISQAKQIKKQGKVNDLVEIGNKYSADTVAAQIAGKVNEKTGAYKLSMLLHDAKAELTEQNQNDITRALVDRGMNETDAKSISKGLAKAVDGGNLSPMQKRVLETNDVVTDVMKEVIINRNSTVNQRLQAVNDINGGNNVYGTEVEPVTKEQISANFNLKNQIKSAISRHMRGLSPSEDATINDMIDKANLDGSTVIGESNYSPIAANLSQAKPKPLTANVDGKVSKDNKTVNLKTGNEVNIKKISEIKNGKINYELDNGEKVSNSDISYSNSDEALVYESMALMDYDANTANAVIQGFKANSNISASDYVIGMQEGYHYGWTNTSENMMNGKEFNNLSKSQQSLALSLGRDARKADTSSRKANVSTQNASKSDTGKLVYEMDRAVDTKSLNNVQRVALREAEVLAEMTGAPVHVYESVLNKNGQRVFARDVAGHKKGTKAPNGFYDTNTGIVYVDINAGNKGQGTILYTLAHEYTHMIRQWSPEKFDALADFLVSEYGKNNVSLEALINTKMRNSRLNGKKLSYDAAYEEVVADSMQTMLTDSNIAEKLAKLKKTDKGLWDKLKELINKLFKGIQKVYSKYNPDSMEAQYVKRMGDSLQRLSDLFSEGLADASNNIESASDINVLSKVKGAKSTNSAKVSDEYSEFSFEGKKYSDRDSEYLELAKDPEKNKDALQKMVEEVARENGYDSPMLYHGTDAFGFTKIKTSGIEKGAEWSPFFAANKEEISSSYVLYGKKREIASSMDEDTIEEAREIAIEEREEKIKDLIGDFRRLIDRYFSEWVFGQSDNSYLEKLVDNANPVQGEGDGVYDVLSDIVYDSFYDYQDNFDEYEDADDWAENSPEGNEIFYKITEIEGEKSAIYDIESGKELGGIYALYANLENMYIVDGKGCAWNELRPEGLPKLEKNGYKDVPYRTRDVAEWAKNNGYNGVIFKNIKDNGAYGRTPAGDVYTFFNPESQVKSADIVTYDDNGNVIPLSERFNSENEDIRYSDRDTKDVYGFEINNNANVNEDLLEELSIHHPSANVDLNGNVTVYHRTSKSNAENIKKTGIMTAKEDALFFSSKDSGYASGYGDTVVALKIPSTVLEVNDIFDGEVHFDIPLKRVANQWQLNVKKYLVTDNNVLYQDRDPDSMDNRTILSNALAETAKTPAEKQLIERYQKMAKDLSVKEVELASIRKEIHNISFGKGKKDKARLAQLNAAKNSLVEYIDRNDRKLLSLEASKPMKDILLRERESARKKYEKQARESLDKYREYSKKKLEDTKKYYQESRKKATENRKKTEIRNHIKGIAEDFRGRLQNGTDTHYVPKNLVNGIISVCDAIDPTGVNQDTKAAQKHRDGKTALLELKNQYDKIKTEDYEFSSEFNEEFSSSIAELAEVIGSTPLRDMDLNQLEDVNNIISDISFMIKDATKQIGTAEKISNYEAGQELIVLMSDVKAKKLTTGKVSGFFRNWMTNPMRAVKEMSGYDKNSRLVKLFNELNEGRRKKDTFVMECNKELEKITSTKEDRKNFIEAVEKPFDFELKDINGKPLKISKMQAMQLVLTFQREQANPNRKHLETGAIIPDVELQVKGKFKEAFDKGQQIGFVDHEFISAITNKLSEWDKKYMALSKSLFNSKCKYAVNETSMVTKHRLIATENDYIPYEVDKDYVAKDSDNVKFDATIEGMGMLKSVKQNAKQQLVMRGLNAVLDDHIENVGKVYGLSIPIRNWNKVFNMKQTEVDGGKSVKSSIRGTWGDGGVSIVDQTVADLQTPRKGDRVKLFSSVKSAFVVSTLASNVSVWMKQAASYPTAGAILSGKALTKGLVDYVTKSGNKITAENVWNEIDEHTSQHWIRRRGLSVQELGEINQSHGWQKKLNEKLGKASPMNWIQAMDVATTAALWYACKAEVESNGTKVSDQNYWNEVTSLYDRVIEDTQPMYDPLHRAEITKKQGLNNIIMFQTQPIQNSGILRDGAMEMRAAVKKYGKNSNEAKQAGKQYRMAVTSQLASHFVFTSMTLLASALLHRMNPWRDDDDELTPESVATVFAEKFGQSVFGAVVPVLGNYITSAIDKLFNGSRYDVLSDPTVDKVNTSFDTLSKLKEPSVDAFVNVGCDIASYFGIPASNAKNILNGIVLHTQDIINDEFLSFEAGFERSKKQNIKKFYESYSSGDYRKANKIKMEVIDDAIASAVESGKEEAEAKSSVRSSFTSCLKPLFMQAYQNKDSQEMENIRKAMKATGLYEDVVNTTQTWIKNSKK